MNENELLKIRITESGRYSIDVMNSEGKVLDIINSNLKFELSNEKELNSFIDESFNRKNAVEKLEEKYNEKHGVNNNEDDYFEGLEFDKKDSIIVIDRNEKYEKEYKSGGGYSFYDYYFGNSDFEEGQVISKQEFIDIKSELDLNGRKIKVQFNKEKRIMSVDGKEDYEFIILYLNSI